MIQNMRPQAVHFRRLNRASLGALALFAVTAPAHAVLVYTGGTATENFDGIATTTQTAFFSSTVGAQTLITGSTFEGTRLGGTGSTMNLIADDGTSNAGAIHSLGAAGSGERALGLLGSGSHWAGVGVQIQNGTANALSSITVSFTQENWRNSTSTQNVMVAAWGRTGGGMSAADYITSSTMVNVSALNLVGPDPVTTNGALDGNNAGNQAVRSFTFNLGTPLAAGDSLFLRWQDANDVGNDADLAIDSFTVSAQAVPEPATLAALSLGAAALLRRRRR